MSPPRARVGVSADAFVEVVRVYADRVHDDVRRLGCDAGKAADVVESSALGLCERLRVRPHEVADLVGTWFRDARVHAERVARGGKVTEDLDAGEGIVRRSEDDAAARLALAGLGERDRVALLLRDAYDLPYLSTGVALGTTTDAAACVVARARLRFLALVTDMAPNEPEGHDAELARTARLADGSLPADDVSAAERHAVKCAVCKPLLPAQHEARRLLTGLAILAMADADRDLLIARARAVAARVLPSAAEVAAAVEGGGRGRVLPFTVIAGSLGSAVAAGALIALATGDAVGPTPRTAPVLIEPTISRTPTPTPTTASPTPTPTATRTVTPTRTVAPSVTFSRTPTPTVAPTTEFTYSARPGSEAMALSRTSGRNGTNITVTGTGWAPGRRITLTYNGPLGPTGSRADAIPDRFGRFVTEIACYDPQNLPGPHTIQASNDAGQSESDTFTAT